MKYIFKIIFFLIFMFSICSCTTEKTENFSPVGKWKLVPEGIFLGDAVFNADSTFLMFGKHEGAVTMADSAKGTWNSNGDTVTLVYAYKAFGETEFGWTPMASENVKKIWIKKDSATLALMPPDTNYGELKRVVAK